MKIINENKNIKSVYKMILILFLEDNYVKYESCKKI